VPGASAAALWNGRPRVRLGAGCPAKTVDFADPLPNALLLLDADLVGDQIVFAYRIRL
jgi:hypothetical protein